MPRYFSPISSSLLKRLVRSIAPEFAAHALMQAFGERFGKAIGKRLEQNRGIVVVVVFELRQFALDADACGYGECADPVAHAAFFRRNEIGKAEVRPPGWFVDLLAQEMQMVAESSADAGSPIDLDIVTNARRRP